MKSGQEEYYQKLAAEDYYLKGGEPPGRWLGQGGASLGLAGNVEAADLTALFRGFSRAGQKLVQNAGKENRQPGWDLTLSAPKSVSVLWSQLEGERQQAIQLAHAQAVSATIGFIEKHFSYSRLGKGGADQVRVKLIVAAFEHSCSRALDPQLHTHCLVMNLGIDSEGVARSILSKPFYEAKMLAGAFYRMELARLLQSMLGVEIERPLDRDGKPQPWFEIKGVSKSILSHFSKRRAAIEAELGARGLESASAAAFAALSTRQTKSIVPPRSELHQRWRSEGQELGFSLDDVFSKPQTLTPEALQKQFRIVLEEAVAALTFGENSFGKEDLTRCTLEAALGCGMTAEEIAAGVERELAVNPMFVPLGTRNGKSLWTTTEVLAVEQEFLQSIDALSKRSFRPVASPAVEAAATRARGEGASSYQLDEEQQEAVKYITQDRGAIKVVSGFAGAGKTDMLSAAKEALEKGGYRVIGTALAGVAARSLQEKTGIESATIRLRELQLYPDLTHTLKHHAAQLLRAALGKRTYKLPRLKLDAKTVLVIDEAGMVGTRDFALLAKAVVDHGGSIVAIGDEKQLSSIERGGCFAHLVKTVPGVRLDEIRRQVDEGDRRAVKALSAGEAEEALRHYADKGQLYVGSAAGDVEEELISEWAKNGGCDRPNEHRIFAGTRADVDRFNKLCQWERVQAGLVDPTERVEHDGQIFMVGDQVRFSTASRARGIAKGESGTVIACKDGFSGKYVAVARRLGRQGVTERTLFALKHHAKQLIAAALGKRTERLPPRDDVVLVPLKSLNPLAKPYKGLALDYAMTTHLGQGQTVANSYVLLGGKMSDRELSYVQGSRHKERLFLYCKEQEAGRRLTELARKHRPVRHAANNLEAKIPDYSMLARQMAMSRAKELALSTADQLQGPHVGDKARVPEPRPQLESM
jgi:conjugative relaxase-like TrwC/TraI family protein